MPSLGKRFGALLLAGSIEALFVAAARHHAQTRSDVKRLEEDFFGRRPPPAEPRALVFTDTFDDTNGVAGTMRRLAEAGAGEVPLTVVTSGDPRRDRGLVVFAPDWSAPLPAYETIDLARADAIERTWERSVAELRASYRAAACGSEQPPALAAA